MVDIEMSDTSELDALMDAAGYRALVEDSSQQED
jgi:hypothetical protein